MGAGAEGILGAHPLAFSCSQNSTRKFVVLVQPSVGRRNCTVELAHAVQLVGAGAVPEGQFTLHVVLRVAPVVDEGSG